ncbi:MAG: hypothetical protein E6Q97_15420 [Desulfurellales bacterium]|nr:MAG: hypothetical protein E6Q97_15420 [Desulfurellales bacterium]
MKRSVTEHGSILVTRYDMKEGDSVPLHDHRERPGSEHITIVASGTVVISFPELGQDYVVTGEALFDYEGKQQKHSIRAITDAVLFNVMKGLIT